MSLEIHTGDRLVREFCTPESTVAPGWLIGARSRLMDSWNPMPELIRVPALSLQAGSVCVRMYEGVSQLGLPTSRAGWLKWYLRNRHRTPNLDIDVPVLDLRFEAGGNIAHAFCWTGLLTLLAKQALKEETGDDSLTVVVPGDAKEFVTCALETLGINTIKTFGLVRGNIVTIVERGRSVCLRLGPHLLPQSLGRSLEAGPATPRKLFISRRGTRCMENETEIWPLLASRGFTRIYAEDLPVAEQARHLANATHIVAIHGAALGALVCRAAVSNRSPLRLVELFGPGYIVTLYRELASILGDSWIAVRGRVTPEVVRDTDRSGLVRAHEKSNFVIDPEALRLALDASEQRVDPQCTVTL